MRRRLPYKLSQSLVDIKTEKFVVPNSETRTRRSHVCVGTFSSSLFFLDPLLCEWNTLPSDIVNSKSLNCLKTNLVNYLKYE